MTSRFSAWADSRGRLQLFGTKNWRIYPQAVRDAVVGYPASKRHPELESPDASFTLSPGDCLYLPRGLPHDAESTAGASLHLTLGIRSPTWLDVLGRVFETAHEIPDLRASLPLKYASSLAPQSAAEPEELALGLRQVLNRTSEWLRDRDEHQLAALEVERQRMQKRSPRGVLAQLATLQPIQTATAFERNRSHRWTLHSDASDTLLLVGSAALKFPTRIRPALEHLLSVNEVTAEDLGPYLDAAGALVLLKRLHREGLLVRIDG